jgi:hypothetical protein
VVNPITFQGNPIFRNTAVGTTRTLSLLGPITYGVGANPLTIDVDNPNLTVAMTGPTSGLNTITSFSKTGLGNLNMNFTGIGTAVPISITGGGTLSIFHDGDGDVQNESIYTGVLTYDAAAPNITIGRAGNTVLWNQAINKILAPTSSAMFFENGITLANSNQYQLMLNDNKALNANLGATGPV